MASRYTDRRTAFIRQFMPSYPYTSYSSPYLLRPVAITPAVQIWSAGGTNLVGVFLIPRMSFGLVWSTVITAVASGPIEFLPPEDVLVIRQSLVQVFAECPRQARIATRTSRHERQRRLSHATLVKSGPLRSPSH